MTPFEIFILFFTITFVALVIRMNGGFNKTMFVEYDGCCPKCGVELTNVDLELHSCPRCNTTITKRNIKWVERD